MRIEYFFCSLEWEGIDSVLFWILLLQREWLGLYLLKSLFEIPKLELGGGWMGHTERRSVFSCLVITINLWGQGHVLCQLYHFYLSCSGFWFCPVWSPHLSPQHWVPRRLGKPPGKRGDRALGRGGGQIGLLAVMSAGFLKIAPLYQGSRSSLSP